MPRGLLPTAWQQGPEPFDEGGGGGELAEGAERGLFQPFLKEGEPCDEDKGRAKAEQPQAGGRGLFQPFSEEPAQLGPWDEA